MSTAKRGLVNNVENTLQPGVAFNQLTDILDRLYDSLEINFTTDAALALTQAQCDYGVLVFTDTGPVLTGPQDVEFTAAFTPKMVRNNTAEALTLFHSAGTGVVLAAGDTVLIGCGPDDVFAGTGGGGSGAGGASIGVQFLADTASTTDADPGAGNLRWNHATQTSATVLYLDDATVDGASLTAIWPRLNAGGVLFLQHATNQDIWQIWEFTAINDAAGYAKLTVTLWGASGTFADNDPILATLDKGQATPASTAGRHAIWVPAGAMSPSATGGCASLATIASAANQPDIQTLNFDPTTAEYAQFSLRMPKSWDEGTVTFAPVWSHGATTTNFGVVWTLQGVAVSDDDTIAVNFGTAQSSADTGGTTNDAYMGPESSAITIAGTPAAEDLVFFRAARLPTDASDTMTIDARLHGITVYITTNADTDA